MKPCIAHTNQGVIVFAKTKQEERIKQKVILQTGRGIVQLCVMPMYTKEQKQQQNIRQLTHSEYTAAQNTLISCQRESKGAKESKWRYAILCFFQDRITQFAFFCTFRSLWHNIKKCLSCGLSEDNPSVPDILLLFLFLCIHRHFYAQLHNIVSRPDRCPSGLQSDCLNSLLPVLSWQIQSRPGPADLSDAQLQDMAPPVSRTLPEDTVSECSPYL